MKVGDILESKKVEQLFTVLPDDTLATAIRLACAKGIGALLVMDAAGKLAGILTERDVMHEANAGSDFSRKRVKEVMKTNLISVSPDDDIHVAMDTMINRRIRHLPVMDREKVCGIITIRDVIYSMRKADETDARLLVDYIRGNIRV